ncbi:variant erythrocyte surface antigen-1 family protein [Babesia caballi]|uniref:Variant erythrocyte surface antigen-1 family protein n=1 Tax=Babesia caballi TaxID=5871 RepID=A0AAV4LWX6_BABCB|nr:variant erythrocyte surface antigen-1 family protein [Babesia caballi]
MAVRVCSWHLGQRGHARPPHPDVLTLPLSTPLSGRPSNLKEAIDWILRVTGKDGQDSGGSGHSGTAGLQMAVNDLLSTAGITQIKPEIKINQTLVENLAGGLAKFIGYKENNKNGLIGIGGIAVSNDPLERLRDGMLGFWIGVLGELKRYNKALDLKMDETKLVSAMKNIKAALGGGLHTFKSAVTQVETVLRDVDVQSIKEVLQKLKDVSKLGSQGNLSGFAGKVEKYFEAALGSLKDKISGTAQTEIGTLKESLTTLVTKICSNCTTSKPIDLTQQDVKKGIDAMANRQTGTLTNLRTAIAKNEIAESQHRFLVEVVVSGTNGFLRQLRRKYGSYYEGATWRDSVSYFSGGISPALETKCAQIFLSCVPFIWSGLSYLFWRSNLNNSEGGFKDLTLSGGDAKAYMFTMGYTNLNQISGEKMGADVFEAAMKGFKDFKDGMAKAQRRADDRVRKFQASAPTPTFPKFLHELEKQATNISTSIGSNVQNNPMSLAYLVAKCYFKGVHLTSSQSRGRPSTIRQMLYWVAGLPFAPGYESLKAHVSGIFRGALGDHTATDPAELRLPVAVSGSTSKRDFFSPASVTSYILTTACTIPNTLAFLQGRYDSSGPLLHSVFSNSMKFKYPASGAALFSELCDYAYALKFHLTFLHQQCKGKYSEGFGWRHCKYGQSVNNGLPNGGSVPAWICAGYQCTDDTTCYHNGKTGIATNKCYHNDAKEGKGCGDPQGKPSPLQAFLTDTLKGFRLNSSESISTHLDNHSPGSMCHVKMGFTADTLLNATLMGYYLYHPLNFLCGNPNSPLPQLCDQLTCLSRRTPRTLGDLFGFIWHLNGQLFSDELIIHDLKTIIKQNPYSVEDFIEQLKAKLRSRHSLPASAPGKSGVVKSLESMAHTVPFLYQLFTLDESKFLPDLIFDLTQHCHRRHVGSNGSSVTHTNPSGKSCSNPNDLWSIYNPVYSDTEHAACRSRNCGGYLQPLTHALGSAFAPTYASSYLSCLLYLADDLRGWLNELRVQFEKLICSHCGSTCQNGGQCHGSTDVICQCDSVVKCSGVLPLLYANGFHFHNAYLLNDTQTKRTCKKFHDQLTAVLAQDENTPLFKLLLTIDEFLYMFRFYFFYNLSSFWLCSLLILLYFIFYGIDVLHIRSHVHLSSSNSIAPIGLLTTGKALPVTKLKYIAQ